MNVPLEEYKSKARNSIECLMKPDDGLFDRRLAALARFEELGYPNPRLEAWRYTSVEGLLKQDFATPPADITVNQLEVETHFLKQPVAGRLVFVDGLYQAQLSECQHTGIKISSLKSALAEGNRRVLEAVGSQTGLGEDGFAALNLAGFQDGALIQVFEGVKLSAPIELLHLTSRQATGCKIPTRHLILMETGADAELIERYQSLEEGIGSFNHLVYEISLAESAQLTHKRLQMESDQAYHLSDIHIALQARANYRGVNAAVGSRWSRTVLHNRFMQADAHCELDGLYLVSDGQLSDYHLDVDHQVPHCTSRENFKGILRGSGRAVFDGLIQVGEQAQKSEAHLHNANLMLSRRAEVDTKPQLMILADDVVCSHGTTVGQLDQQAMFYMRSRGLNEEQAKRLLCQGFIADVVERFEHPELIEILNQRVSFQETLAES
ncbi:MAG: Fe-S cluster assembly protein SufD [Candidatus Thiodiazotropha sp. 6PLUC2]